MYFKYNIYIAAWLAIVAICSSCGSSEEIVPIDPLEGLIVFGESHIPGTDLSVKIYQYTDELIVGYNRFEILVNKAGFSGAFTDAEITFSPLMDMETMKHASPVEHPESGANFENIFGGAVVFVMPSGDMSSWTLGVKVRDNESEQEGEVILPANVVLPDDARMKSFSMGDDNYFVSLVEPFAPQVGINDFELAIHKKQSMMNWPFANAFNITVEPEMPDMGHGSPNNVDPEHISNGHYVGKINFTMDGYWRIKLKLETAGQSHEMDFDMRFEHKSTQ